MVFSKASLSGEWKWGEHMVSNYVYLGVAMELGIVM